MARQGMVTTKSQIEARLKELQKANEEAPVWGAAVGARAEEIEELKTELNILKAHELPQSEALRVIIESPYQGDIARNMKYLDKALLHSLRKGEAPFAGHALYTRVLDDLRQSERDLGIQRSFAWIKKADLIAAYIDYGITSGMTEGINFATSLNIPVEFRRIGRPGETSMRFVKTEVAPNGRVFVYIRLDENSPWIEVDRCNSEGAAQEVISLYNYEHDPDKRAEHIAEEME